MTSAAADEARSGSRVLASASRTEPIALKVLVAAEACATGLAQGAAGFALVVGVADEAVHAVDAAAGLSGVAARRASAVDAFGAGGCALAEAAILADAATTTAAPKGAGSIEVGAKDSFADAGSEDAAAVIGAVVSVAAMLPGVSAAFAAPCNAGEAFVATVGRAAALVGSAAVGACSVFAAGAAEAMAAEATRLAGVAAILTDTVDAVATAAFFPFAADLVDVPTGRAGPGDAAAGVASLVGATLFFEVPAGRGDLAAVWGTRVRGTGVAGFGGSRIGAAWGEGWGGSAAGAEDEQQEKNNADHRRLQGRKDSL